MNVYRGRGQTVLCVVYIVHNIGWVLVLISFTAFEMWVFVLREKCVCVRGASESNCRVRRFEPR